MPGSIYGAVLAILSALALASVALKNSIFSYKFSYCCGLIVNILGFYWLADTISLFGGFPGALSWLIFGFFVAISSLQFVLFAFIYNRLPANILYLRLALAWVSAEFLFPRIFPWELSHPLSGIPILTQVADIAGTPLLTFLLLTCSSLFISAVAKKESSRTSPLYWLVILLGLWIGYGAICIQKYSSTSGSTLKVGIVQANVAVVQQGNIAIIKQNEQQYVRLSKEIYPDVELLIWPESIVQDWIWADTKRIENDPRLPFFGPTTSLLTGALTFETQKRIFNSALLIDKNGAIPPPYHKRILMPFGEYMPFSEIFPWLNEINANLALFTPGTESKVFELPIKADGRPSAKISPLVCYEDLIPRLARDATRLGSEILINLTNDAWFGSGPASIHHNMMASFRAIENKRYLIRSTNNGQTAVINPLGSITASIPRFSEAVTKTTVAALNTSTIFSKYLGPWLWWAISSFVLIFCLLKKSKSP